MSKKLVTTAQAEQIKKMANEKGVPRQLFQDNLLDNGTMSRVLDGIKNGLPVTIGTQLAPPPSARLHVVRVKVQLDQEWQEAINLASPDTPGHYNVRKVADLYPPTGVGVVEEELILLNYPNGNGGWGKAIAWAEQFQLKRTDPRHVFAIGKDHPNFNHDVGVNPTYVVATKECAFGDVQQACYVWWDDSKRKADLRWVGFYDSARGWFAFRK